MMQALPHLSRGVAARNARRLRGKDSAVGLSFGKQLGGEPLSLGDPLDLEGDRVDGLLEMLQTTVIQRRLLARTTLQNRQRADDAADHDDGERADDGHDLRELDDVRVDHGSHTGVMGCVAISCLNIRRRGHPGFPTRPRLPRLVR